MLKFEDKGIDSVFIKNMDGVRIASKTSIQTLFEQVLNIVHREGEDIELFITLVPNVLCFLMRWLDNSRDFN